MSDYLKTLRVRPRRLRRTAAVRDIVRETAVSAADLIQPVFVIEGDGDPEPITSMPGQMRWPLGRLVGYLEQLYGGGIGAVALFPKLDPALKTADGGAALDEATLVVRAVKAVKAALPGLTVITDIALDPYTTHGHDGVLTADCSDVANDETVAILAKMACLHAAAGVDWVAPSDMMDGRIGAIRQALDGAGFSNTAILAYSAKFASAYYGPFRDAVGSSQAAGTTLLDKATYQLDPANRREAVREALLDCAEAADVVMVKPAGPYLDIIRDVREAVDVPVCAYQVSGEYAQIEAAAAMGWLDRSRCRDESLLAIKRAGADMIITYFAGEMQF